MGLMNDPQGDARARMEQAEKASRRAQQQAREAGGAADAPRRPRRYKLYDRIRDRVSVTTMNVIIGATALLLILALIIGIATGNPQR